MPTTPTSGLPYPALTDPPNAPQQISNLAAAIDGRVFNSNLWTAFTPTWTALNINPTLGNGTLSGRYQKMGRMVIFDIWLSAGSTTSAGAGPWTIGGLPFLSASREQRLSLSMWWNALGIHWNGVGVIGASTSVVIPRLPISAIDCRLATAQSANSTNAASTGVPLRDGNFSFLPSDNLAIYGTYEAAS